MREYAALYSSKTNTWSVIAKDSRDDSWFVEIPDAGNKSTAVEIARVMTESAQQ